MNVLQLMIKPAGCFVAVPRSMGVSDSEIEAINEARRTGRIDIDHALTEMMEAKLITAARHLRSLHAAGWC